MEIREYKNGRFQVFNGDKVLRPCNLEWEGDYQVHHDFMYFDTLKKAREAARAAKIKHEGKLTVVGTHEI